MLTAGRRAPILPWLPPTPLLSATGATLAGWLAAPLVLPINLNGFWVALTLVTVLGFVVRFGCKVSAVQPFGAANSITLTRGVLTALIAGCIGIPLQEYAIYLAIGLAALCLASDGLDGWIARRTGTSSAFGARLDMEIDALLMLVLCVLAFQLDKAGWWVLLIGLMRYGFVGASWVLPALNSELPPSFRRKTVCAIQGVALTVCLAPALPPSLTQPLLAICLASLAWSFAIDCRWLLAERRT